MKIEAYINLDWLDEDIVVMPGEEEDTLSRQNKIKKMLNNPWPGRNAYRVWVARGDR